MYLFHISATIKSFHFSLPKLKFQLSIRIIESLKIERLKRMFCRNERCMMDVIGGIEMRTDR